MLMTDEQIVEIDSTSVPLKLALGLELKGPTSLKPRGGGGGGGEGPK